MRPAEEQAPSEPAPAAPQSEEPVAIDVEPREAGSDSVLQSGAESVERIDTLLRVSSTIERSLEEQLREHERMGPAHAGLVSEARALLVELREVQAGLLLARDQTTAGDEERLRELEERLFRVRAAAFVAFKERQ